MSDDRGPPVNPIAGGALPGMSSGLMDMLGGAPPDAAGTGASPMGSVMSSNTMGSGGMNDFNNLQPPSAGNDWSSSAAPAGGSSDWGSSSGGGSWTQW